MIPKYSKYEIQALVKEKFNSTFEHEYDERIIDDLLKNNGIWLTEHYKTAANILGISVENLVSNIPTEDLESISFRSEENTEEINRTVEEINEIFELLTYQLKIGHM